MDYSKHYDLLINKALHRDIPLGYTEKHHIIPKALGGTNNKYNLVALTAREHCIAHLLLAKIHGGNMWVAAMRMLCHKTIKSSRIYQTIREKSAEASSKANIGNTIRRGKKHTDETKAKISKSKKGQLVDNKNPMFGLKGKDSPAFGRKVTQQTKNKISKTLTGKTGKLSTGFKGTTVATNIETGAVIIMNGYLEIKNAGFNQSHVSECINGKRKSHKGYTFYRVFDCDEPHKTEW